MRYSAYVVIVMYHIPMQCMYHVCVNRVFAWHHSPVCDFLEIEVTPPHLNLTLYFYFKPTG